MCSEWCCARLECVQNWTIVYNCFVSVLNWSLLYIFVSVPKPTCLFVWNLTSVCVCYVVYVYIVVLHNNFVSRLPPPTGNAFCMTVHSQFLMGGGSLGMRILVIYRSPGDESTIL